MKILLLLLLTSSAFAQINCETRRPIDQASAFRWIMSVSKEDKEFVSDTYFFGKKAGSLSEREMSWSLVGFYTDEHFETINLALRKGVTKGPVAYLAEAIDQSLCDFPTFEGEVYRGATLPQAVIDEHKELEPTVLKSFTSTSKKEKVGCNFAGNVIYKIRSLRGRLIEEASLKKFEKEVLFHKATRFQVTKVTTDRDIIKEETSCKRKGLTLIKMEEY